MKFRIYGTYIVEINERKLTFSEKICQNHQKLMIETIKFWFINQHPILSMIAGLFTWILTAIGSGYFSLTLQIEKF